MPIIKKTKKILSLLIIIGLLAINSSVRAVELTDLQHRQAKLLANSNALSTLRVQYAHAQLWFIFKDTSYVYWNYELKRRLAQLEQINTALVSSAFQSLVNLAINSPGTAPCSHFGNNSLECSISSVQSINNELQKRSQQIFSATNASKWFAEWSKRWQKTLETTQGYLELKQDIEKFLVDNPELAGYLQLQQDFNIKSAELLAETNVDIAKELNEYTQKFSDELKTILDATGYNAQLALYNERVRTLVETNPDYVLLQLESAQLAESLENLMQEIHAAIMNCTNEGHNNLCFDSGFNNFLQSLLPQHNVAANQVLTNYAWLTEKNYQFWNNFAMDPAIQSLQKESTEILEATLEPVIPELKDVQETYYERVFSIKIIREKLMELWNKLVNIGEQLGLIQS